MALVTSGPCAVHWRMLASNACWEPLHTHTCEPQKGLQTLALTSGQGVGGKIPFWFNTTGFSHQSAVLETTD